MLSVSSDAHMRRRLDVRHFHLFKRNPALQNVENACMFNRLSTMRRNEAATHEKKLTYLQMHRQWKRRCNESMDTYSIRDGFMYSLTTKATDFESCASMRRRLFTLDALCRPTGSRARIRSCTHCGYV